MPTTQTPAPARPPRTATPTTPRKTAVPRKTVVPRKGATPHKAAAAKHAAEIVQRLRQAYPDADCELRWETPLQLLIATILSAQCTDARVNIVTRKLFQKYRTPQDYLEVPEEELQEDIRTTGFFRNKAKNIRGACRVIIDEFGGEVPQRMEDLLKLPGVARKTANVVLGTAFAQAAGFVVDTHIRRLSNRIGWTRQQDPVKIEADLMRLVPPEEWIFLGHSLIWHGRRVCDARKPACDRCTLFELCERRGVKAALSRKTGIEEGGEPLNVEPRTSNVEL